MTTGTWDPVIFSMILRVESTSPPGVLISINKAWSLRRWASSMARAMYSSVMGWMVSLITTLSTSAEAAEQRSASTVRRTKKTRRVMAFFMRVEIGGQSSGVFLSTILLSLLAAEATRRSLQPRGYDPRQASG